MLMFNFRSTALVISTLVFSWPLAAQVPQTTLESTPVAAASMSAQVGDNSNSQGASSGNSAAKFASGSGNIIYLAAGTLLPLVEDGGNGRQHALRTADSLLTSTLLTEGLKRIVREKRPDGSARNSFPSGHATAAFAVATMQANYHPQQAWLWYGGAALIAASRVKLKRHYVWDVLAGAGVGYLTSRFELSRPRGLLLSPLINTHRDGGGRGLAFSASF